MNNANEIKIVIGSWGSYNECNEKALGSKWLTLADYSDWSEIEEELEKVGDNDYIVDYMGMKCHALFNWYVCEYYADDVYSIVKED